MLRRLYIRKATKTKCLFHSCDFQTLRKDAEMARGLRPVVTLAEDQGWVFFSTNTTAYNHMLASSPQSVNSSSREPMSRSGLYQHQACGTQIYVQAIAHTHKLKINL